MSWLRNLRLKPGDFVIALLVILLAAAAAAPFLPARANAVYAEIYVDDVLTDRILLSEGGHDTRQIVGDVINTIEIDGQSIRFAQSTCPDQVCVRTGTLTRSGQTAVCLPNRVILRLTGGAAGVDAIAGGVVR